MLQQQGEVQVRAGVEADLPALTDLYNHYIRETSITFDLEPFTPEQRRPWLHSHPQDGPHRLLVAQETTERMKNPHNGPSPVPSIGAAAPGSGSTDGTLLGYATSSAFRPKAAYAPSVEVTVYCAPHAASTGASARCSTRLSSRRWPTRTCTAPTPGSPSRTRHPSASTPASASGTSVRTRRWAASSAATGTWPGTRRI